MTLTEDEPEAGDEAEASQEAFQGPSHVPLVCTSQCCQESLEVYQEKDDIIISRTKRTQGQRSRQFCCDWYRSYPWLVLRITRLKVFCAYCRYCDAKGLLKDKLSDRAFISSGFCNWKKALERFEQHAKSSVDKEALLAIEVMAQPSVLSQLSSQYKRDQAGRREMLMVTLTSLQYLVRQGLPIRGHEEVEGNLSQLLLLRAKDCRGLKQYIDQGNYLSHEVINEMISIMSTRVLRQILSEIREANIFSLIADEATDVAHKEQLSMTIRWVDKSFQIYETPVELINVPKTDSETLTMVITDCLLRLSLPVGQCRGQAFDGASNMSGHVSGVAQRIQQLESSAIFVHCFAHCTNLCLQTLGKQSQCVHNALELIMGVSQLIRFSPKRSTLFDTLQSQVSPGAPSLKPLCPTRWTVRTRAISAILSNYKLLLDVLEVIQSGRDEYAMKANGYLTSMTQFSTFFGLKLSYLIFSVTEQLSLTLQGKDTTIQEGVQAATLTMDFLQEQRTDDRYDAFYTTVLADSKDLTSEPVLPRQRRPPRKIDSNSASHVFSDTKSYFRKQYYEAIDIVTNELRQRFCQERGMPVAAKLEKLLLNAANATSDIGSDSGEIVEMYSKDLDATRLAPQLQMLPQLLRTYNECYPQTAIQRITNVRTLCDIMNNVTVSRTMFDQINKLLHILLTIPVTTATAERSFSTLRRLKTYLRSTMSQSRLNHLMILHIHKNRTDELNILDIAKEFIEVNDRRIKFFGRFIV